MSPKRAKKDFDKDQMYMKIMPTFGGQPSKKPEEEPEEPPQMLEPEKLDKPDEPDTDTNDLYTMRNFIEDLILRKLDKTMAMLRCCSCDRCKKDVMAEVLNVIPSAYYVVESGEEKLVVDRLIKEKDIQVTSALIKAIQRVKAEARH